ncbi:587_t:CDS:2, partial [Ambispora leptoticha]
MGLLNLEEQLTFYGMYHNNRINILIHVVCVPLLLWSALIWASNFGKLESSTEQDSLWRIIPLQPNLALYAALFYSS